MTDDIQDQERYSICIAKVDEGIDRRYFKYYRIADFDPAVPTEIVPSVVESDVRTQEERRAHPDSLYNPLIIGRYDERGTDFYLFRWGWDYDERGRPLTEPLKIESYFKRGRGLREVIIPEGVHDEEGLRRALREGIPFEGRTTRVFYLAYMYDGPFLLAARCERSDFSFSGGMLSLPPKVTNVRGHTLRAPRVCLDPYEIIESPHPEVPDRRVYGSLEELESDGNVLLRLLDDFADDYVRWFIKEEGITDLTNAERQRTMRRVIENALSRPDALERYLEANVPKEDVDALRHAIAASALEKEDESKRFIRDALLRDDSFRAECVEQVMAESVDALDRKKKELEEATQRLSEVEEKAAVAERRLSDVTSERDSICEEIDRRRVELEGISEAQEAALKELETNIALKLGLKAVAASQQSSIVHSTPELSIVEAVVCNKVSGAQSFVEALSKNMAKLGISCLIGDPEEERLRCAVGIGAAIRATNVLAIPTPLARPLADALAIVIAGKTAKWVQVPSDLRPVQCLLDELPGPDGVTVFENVIDPINEGALFALIESDCAGFIILPFTSHASALLVAKEAWDGMFLPCVESLCFIPSNRRLDGRMWSNGEIASIRKKVDGEDILDATRNLISEFEGLALPNGSYLLPGMVLSAIEDDSENDDIMLNPLCAVTQHLGIVTGLEGESYGLLADKSEGDVGFMQLARRLGRNAV